MELLNSNIPITFFWRTKNKVSITSSDFRNKPFYEMSLEYYDEQYIEDFKERIKKEEEERKQEEEKKLRDINEQMKKVKEYQERIEKQEGNQSVNETFKKLVNR